jgi:signal peptidase II
VIGRLLRLLLVSGAVVALDGWTKQWATATLAYREPVEVLGPFLRFTYTRNSGVAFGLGAGLPFPYYLFSIAAVAVILYLFFKQRVRGFGRHMALALIMGGAIGNLVDRLRSGEVVDFIEIGYGRWHWPVFNVADSAVTVGVVLFALTWPRHGSARAEPGSPGAGSAARAGPGAGGEAVADALGPRAGQGGEAGPLPGRRPDGPLA